LARPRGYSDRSDSSGSEQYAIFRGGRHYYSPTWFGGDVSEHDFKTVCKHHLKSKLGGSLDRPASSSPRVLGTSGGACAIDLRHAQHLEPDSIFFVFVFCFLCIVLAQGAGQGLDWRYHGTSYYKGASVGSCACVLALHPKTRGGSLVHRAQENGDRRQPASRQCRALTVSCSMFCAAAGFV
jgi:hypothetical protein